ncbi:hypothetical protein OWS73_19590 [Burkholderia sp. 1B3(2022)]|uniref:hypothetical protein n=1 Tax=Burkholderia sp. 1B3(2022) TaxID=2997425 RepID=UPI002FC9142D
MPDWLNRVWRIATSVRPAVWPLSAGVALLAVLSCTPAAETLLSPLDRLYWNLVTTGVDYGARDDVVVISIDKKTVAELGAMQVIREPPMRKCSIVWAAHRASCST